MTQRERLPIRAWMRGISHFDQEYSTARSDPSPNCVAGARFASGTSLLYELVGYPMKPMGASTLRDMRRSCEDPRIPTLRRTFLSGVGSAATRRVGRAISREPCRVPSSSWPYDEIPLAALGKIERREAVQTERRPA